MFTKCVDRTTKCVKKITKSVTAKTDFVPLLSYRGLLKMFSGNLEFYRTFGNQLKLRVSFGLSPDCGIVEPFPQGFSNPNNGSTKFCKDFAGILVSGYCVDCVVGTCLYIGGYNNYKDVTLHQPPTKDKRI